MLFNILDVKYIKRKEAHISAILDQMTITHR